MLVFSAIKHKAKHDTVRHMSTIKPVKNNWFPGTKRRGLMVVQLLPITVDLKANVAYTVDGTMPC